MISVLTPSIRPQFLYITQKCLERQKFQDFEWLVEIGLRDRGFTLPSDMNKMLKRAKCERIVILQDCIEISDDALEKINALSNDLWTFPVGQVDDFVTKVPEWDWRIDHPGELPGAHYWETDFACAPTQAFFDVGGYDEEFNKGWSWDNVEIARRMYRSGYKGFCDPSIKGVAIRHDKLTEHPFRTTRESNDKRAEKSKYDCDRGKYVLPYLTKGDVV